MAAVVDNLAAAGRKYRIEYAVLDDGETMPAKTFIESEFKGSPNTITRILATFRHIADNGEINTPDRIFCRERGDIWTFKCKINKLRIRLPCYRDGNRWIVTHGFIKPSRSEWPEQEFTRANEIMSMVKEREKREAGQHTHGRPRHG